MTKFKEIKLWDYFIFQKDSRSSVLTKNFVDNNKWIYPVYSWNTINWFFWNINSYSFNINSFVNKFALLITTVWARAWKTHILNDEYFSLSQNCGMLFIKDDKNKFFNDFLYVVIKKDIEILASKLWNYKSILKNDILNLIIKIPINENWELDLEKQKEIASKYEKIEKIKERIRIIKEDLECKQIIFNKNLNLKTVNIFDVLISPPTNSWLKKEHVSIDKKDWFLPVYSASKYENAIFGWLNENTNWKKYENVLTWNKDGSSWVVFYRKNKFIPYEKVKILEIKDDYKNNLDYNFLRKIIENKLLSFWYSFWVKCSMENVLKTEIDIPIKENWEFDLEKQKEIALKYEKIEKIQKTLIEELEYLEKVKVEL